MIYWFTNTPAYFTQKQVFTHVEIHLCKCSHNSSSKHLHMCTQNQIHKPLIYTMYTNNIKIQMHTDKHMYISHKHTPSVPEHTQAHVDIHIYKHKHRWSNTSHTYLSICSMFPPVSLTSVPFIIYTILSAFSCLKPFLQQCFSYFCSPRWLFFCHHPNLY